MKGFELKNFHTCSRKPTKEDMAKDVRESNNGDDAWV